MSELNPVANTEDAGRAADVVFVHGLGGNAREYWMADPNKPETFWPEWIGKDVPGVGVWSLGYDAAKFAWQGDAMPLYDQAIGAIDRLDNKGIGKRPVVFITHSMGGLIVKEMLRQGHDAGNGRWRALMDQTRGICFISTPHSGSDIARWVLYMNILMPTVAVRDLRAHDPQLRQLNTWYRNHSEGKIVTLAYCEKLPTTHKWLKLIFLKVFNPFRFVVVNESSADPNIRGVVPIPLLFDHLTIHRPISRGSQLYEGVRNFVKECLANPR